MKASKRKIMPIIIISGVVMMVNLVCGFSLLGRSEEPEQPESEEQVVQPSETKKEVSEEPPSEVPSEEVKPTTTETVPTVPPLPTVKALELGKSGFGQDDTSVGYGFMLTNPNTEFAIDFSEYQLAAYDTNGVVVETQTGYIDLLLPGQTMGIAGELWLDEGEIIDRLEIRVEDGRAVVTDIVGGLTTKNAAYQPDDYYPKVVGEVINPFDHEVDDFQIYALLYDAAGNIIGGGNTYASYVPANGTTGIRSYVTSKGDIASVELYPMLPNVDFLKAADKVPTDAALLSVNKSGFGEGDYYSTYAFLVENPNTQYTVLNSFYRIMAYTADNILLDVSEGYVGVSLPKSVVGVSGDFYPPEGTTIASMVVQFKSGEYKNTGPMTSFTTENVALDISGYSPEVTAIINNPYTVQVNDLHVYVVLYDDSNDIVGGGFTYLDFIPASAKSAVEIYVSYGKTPSRAEVYALFSTLSDIP